VTASAPCRVFGDLHGQFRDLLVLFNAYGWPGQKPPAGEQPTQFVFNGDFVDRGAHQLEVLGLLMALKVAFPKKVWLVRGNHEDRSMNEKYGFKDVCLETMGEDLGRKIFDVWEETFDQLPIACLVEGRILVCHGGIGKGDWDLNNLRSLHRPITSSTLSRADMKWLLNILWSDPIEDDDNLVDDDNGGKVVFRTTAGVHDSPRKDKAVQFGWDVTKTFCARNGLGLIIRSHQCKPDGFGFDVMHDDHLVRVFSARDYEGNGNDSATCLIRNTSAADASQETTPGTRSVNLNVRMHGLSSYTKDQDGSNTSWQYEDKEVRGAKKSLPQYGESASSSSSSLERSDEVKASRKSYHSEGGSSSGSGRSDEARKTASVRRSPKV